MPKLEEVIELQHAEGYWTASARPVLQKFFIGESCEDTGVKEMLATANVTSENVYMTLIAVYVLNGVFGADRKQWTVLDAKAKEYMKAAVGMKNAYLYKLIAKIKIELAKP